MTTICKKCGGYVADINFNPDYQHPCKDHRKPDFDINPLPSRLKDSGEYIVKKGEQVKIIKS